MIQSRDTPGLAETVTLPAELVRNVLCFVADEQLLSPCRLINKAWREMVGSILQDRTLNNLPQKLVRSYPHTNHRSGAVAFEMTLEFSTTNKKWCSIATKKGALMDHAVEELTELAARNSMPPIDPERARWGLALEDHFYAEPVEDEDGKVHDVNAYIEWNTFSFDKRPWSFSEMKVNVNTLDWIVQISPSEDAVSDQTYEKCLQDCRDFRRTVAKLWLFNKATSWSYADSSTFARHEDCSGSRFWYDPKDWTNTGFLLLSVRDETQKANKQIVLRSSFREILQP